MRERVTNNQHVECVKFGNGKCHFRFDTVSLTSKEQSMEMRKLRLEKCKTFEDLRFCHCGF